MTDIFDQIHQHITKREVDNKLLELENEKVLAELMDSNPEVRQWIAEARPVSLGRKLKKLSKPKPTRKQKPYTNCRKHGECRKVKGGGTVLEIVNCPWCNYPVGTNNPGQWCADCYCLFRVDKDKGEVHFGRKIQKSFAEALAINIAKSGGIRMGVRGE
jgi:hypothetical protein